MKAKKELEEVKDKAASVAAFFDLDGTLLPLPSLEQRFFRVLRYGREFPLKNYLLWLREAVQLVPRGITAVMHMNKMYLKGVRPLDKSGMGDHCVSPGHKSGHHDEGQASMPPKGTPRRRVPRFFPEALDRVEWHARQGHLIVLVTGTLEPLARAAAEAAEAELAARGIAAKIRVCATRMKEIDGKWTGRIQGKAMFGEAKASAVKDLADEMRLDLAQCWAYGDSVMDRWLLAAVGNPAAVNPTPRLERLAGKRGWTMLRWSEEGNRTRSCEERGEKKVERFVGPPNKSPLQQSERCA